MKYIILLLLSIIPLTAQITYEGNAEGAGKGKHLVFVASDHEYRAEETCTALARILAKHHGFKCTVLYGVNEQGEITAGASDIKGLAALKEADLMVIFTRFLNLPEEQMQHIIDYTERGGPVVGFRTSSHAFKIPKDSKFARYSFNYKGEDYVGGFGQQILGNTWEGHYGRNHIQGTRIQLIPKQKSHPILVGVEDGAFCYAGGYNGVIREGMTVLTNSQPMVALKKDAGLDEKKAPVASTWIREYTSTSGQKGRVFHSTQGASEDLLDENYRRMVVNGIFWAAGQEDAIKADANIEFVGPYTPSVFATKGYVRGVKPEDLQNYDSAIMPGGPGPVPEKARDRRAGKKSKKKKKAKE